MTLRPRTPTTDLERTRSPERWSPAAFRPVLDAVERAVIRSRLDAYLDDAVARGALDEGNADYADSWIDTQLAAWRTALEEQEAGRKRAGARLLAIADGRRAEQTARLQELVERRALVAGQRDALAAELGAAPAAAIAEPDALPEAELLRGHTLKATPGGTNKPALVRPIRPADDDADGAAAAAN